MEKQPPNAPNGVKPDQSAGPRDYYELLSRAVAALQDASPDARGKIYDRARKALADQLGNVAGAQLSSDQFAVETGALADAIERLEADFAVKAPSAPGGADGELATRASTKSPPAMRKSSPSGDRRSKGAGKEKIGPEDGVDRTRLSLRADGAGDKLLDSIARLDSDLLQEHQAKGSVAGEPRSATASSIEVPRPASIGAPPSSPPPTQVAPSAVGDPGTAREIAPEDNTPFHAGLGKIVSVLAGTAEFRNLALGHIVALVTPALAAQQALIIEARPGKDGPATPVAAILWASVSPEVDARLSTNLEQPFKLGQDEWRCGEIPWLVLVAGDSRFIQPALTVLAEKIAKGRRFKMRTRDAKGNTVVGELRPKLDR